MTRTLLTTTTEMLSLKAALYCRISREDDTLYNNSASIITQQDKLEDFAQKSNILVHNTYCDDGYTGTNFNRPAFIKMINDIKDGRVNCVIVKDLSRLGREYIQSGELLENFSQDTIHASFPLMMA